MRIYLVGGNRVTAKSDADIEKAFPGQWTFVEDYDDEAEKRQKWQIAQEDFWDRWTKAERINLDLAMQHDPAATNSAKRSAAEWRYRFEELRSMPMLNLKRNKIENFVRDAETAGILAAGRADQILVRAG